eukprot:6056196-Prymnesium_polylepis.1
MLASANALLGRVGTCRKVGSSRPVMTASEESACMRGGSSCKARVVTYCELWVAGSRDRTRSGRVTERGVVA